MGTSLLRILRGGDNGLTPFGLEHKDSIAEIATLFLKDFHDEHEKSFVEYFCRQFNLLSLTDADIAKLESFFLDPEDFHYWIKATQNQKNSSRQDGANARSLAKLSTQSLTCSPISLPLP